MAVSALKMTQEATTVTISLPDEAATRALGAALAAASNPGTAILLHGALGAGKTTLVDGFTQGMGAGPATSPSFVIAHSYPTGRIPIWHVDLFRIEDAAAVASLDLAQYVSDETITLCEWAERAGNAWPQDCLTIELAIEGNGRRAKIAALGPRSQRLVQALRDAGIAINA